MRSRSACASAELSSYRVTRDVPLPFAKPAEQDGGEGSDDDELDDDRHSHPIVRLAQLATGRLRRADDGQTTLTQRSRAKRDARKSTGHDSSTAADDDESPSEGDGPTDIETARHSASLDAKRA